MLEALKNGPPTTMPLQICMNSSLKQSSPSRKSLNDCLMKGPSALADLFTVTLGIRELQYSLTKQRSVQILSAGAGRRAGTMHEDSDLLRR